MKELEILILCVSEENNRINEIWKKHPHYKDLNMSKNLVCDLLIMIQKNYQQYLFIEILF